MVKKYFVRFSTGKYDGQQDAELEKLDEVTELLSRHATNPDFFFKVIYGESVEFEPVEVVKAYRPKAH